MAKKREIDKFKLNWLEYTEKEPKWRENKPGFFVDLIVGIQLWMLRRKSIRNEGRR